MIFVIDSWLEVEIGAVFGMREGILKKDLLGEKKVNWRVFKKIMLRVIFVEYFLF